MSSRTGFAVPAQVVTPDTEDKFPVAETNDIKGAVHYVDTKDDLAGISTQHLIQGMSAYVKDEQAYYDLQENNIWRKREVYKENKTPWKCDSVTHATSYGAVVTIPYCFKSPDNQDYNILEVSGTSNTVIVDERLNQYTILEALTNHASAYSSKGYKLITKDVLSNAVKDTQYSTDAERFDSFSETKLMAFALPYEIQEEDIVKNELIYHKTVSGEEQVNYSIVNIPVNDVYAEAEMKKNDNSTYHLSDELPNVFIHFNDTDDSNVTLGKDIHSTDNYGIALGTESSVIGSGSVAEGYQAASNGEGSVALGRMSKTNGSCSVAIGADASANKNLAVSLGNASVSSGEGSLALGESANASADKAISIGSSFAQGELSLAIGNNATASGSDSIAIGSGSSSVQSSVTLGLKAKASAAHAVAFGETTEAAGENSVVLGTGSKTGSSETNVVSVGASAAGSVMELSRRIIHVADGQNATDAVNKSQLDKVAQQISTVPADAKFTDTTYSVAVPKSENSDGKDGLMSAKDKAKLDSMNPIDTSDFVRSPADGDFYLLKSNADKAYAPAETADNPYVKQKTLDSVLAGYSTTQATDNKIQEALGITQENSQGIYQKKSEAFTEEQIKSWIQDAVKKALFTTSSAGTDIAVYVRQSDIDGIVKDAIDKQNSADRGDTSGTYQAIQNREGERGEG